MVVKNRKAQILGDGCSHEGTMVHITADYIKSVFNETIRKNVFVDLSGRTSLLIPTYLILKMIGVNKHSAVPYNENTARDAAFLLHTPYLSTEAHPLEKYLINPFHKSYLKAFGSKAFWRAESLDDYVKLGRHGLCNNYVGGGTIWDRILATSEKTPIRFRANYIEAIKKECGISYSNRIDITQLAAWCFRELDFDGAPSASRTTQDVIETFLGTFNITEEEQDALFEITGESIQFNLAPLDMTEVRRECFNLDSNADIVMEPLLQQNEINIERRVHFMSINPSIEVISELLRIKKQIILFGPPGVGKTWIAMEIAKVSEWNGNVEVVQFHPTYGFEHFIGGFFPASDTEITKADGGEVAADTGAPLKIIYKEGVLPRLAKVAETNPALLIIDEINRGNLSQVFGETIMALDRDYKVVISSHPRECELQLPENLHIIGTMNSTDRSIAIVDFAIRRRFAFIRLEPDARIIREHYNNKTKIEEDSQSFDLVDLFERINSRILRSPALGRDFLIGHSYYLLPDKDFRSLERTFNFSILPLIEEYSYGNPSLLVELLGENLPKRLTGEVLLGAIMDFLEE